MALLQSYSASVVLAFHIHRLQLFGVCCRSRTYPATLWRVLPFAHIQWNTICHVLFPNAQRIALLLSLICIGCANTRVRLCNTQHKTAIMYLAANAAVATCPNTHGNMTHSALYTSCQMAGPQAGRRHQVSQWHNGASSS
ncbi:hypothetical protein JKP88DRAFT_230644 [Tribonema minus]|uniref:Uncharacterized protein n=1 Tax=Tribonema minus TaxID=303371 RepID=A0A836CMM8_9STRA|nr:hypothetical protein JKP88DRAFT_230644 [Tribonema minus]